MNLRWTGHAVGREGGKCDDAWIVRERANATVAVLADGVGAARAGGVAARRAVEMLADYCLTRPRAWTPRRALAEFSEQINRHLHAESVHRYGQPELACTLSAVVAEEGRLYGCNVGDSPVFLWRSGRLQAMSATHRTSAGNSAHVVTRALGIEPALEPHFFEADLLDGDLIVLCSDGVSDTLDERALSELLSRHASARTLVSRARMAAEVTPELRDDASAIVLEVVHSARAHSTSAQQLEVLASLTAHQEVDGYRLVRSLADTGRVWLAEDDTGKKAVLKFPPADASDSEEQRDAFVREAWHATRLTSPDLVRAWIPDGASLRCYAMEYLEAPTLRTVLRQRRLSVDDARGLAQFLLRVGQFLLQHDLAHGDIKPENILVLQSGPSAAFRLLDLGTAAELFSVTSRAGTASYLAPERFKGAAISERTEIFAIGVTLYEALTGTYPFGEVERFQTPRFETAARPAARCNPAVPPWLDSIVARAIEPDAERRYQNFSEMAYDLTHPDQVRAHYHKDVPLLARNPVLFYQLLCLVLLALNAWLLAIVARR